MRWRIELSAEVATWYSTLAVEDRATTDRALERLATLGSHVRMPLSRSLGDGLFELRFALQHGRVSQRITSVFDAERQVITLTTFRKTRDNERREVLRARRAAARRRENR